MAHRGALFDRLLVGVFLLVAWQMASFLAGAYWIPSPWQTAQAAAHLLATGELTTNAAYTLQEALYGFLLGGIPGLVLPFLLRRSPIIMGVIEPYLVAGYGLPKLALTPLFLVWFGIGMGSKIAIVTAITFFIIFFNVWAGVKALDLRLVRMAQVLGASEGQVARKIIWPGSIPYIFVGLRTATPYAIGGAVIAELVSSNRGLGYLVQLHAMSFDSKGMFAVLAVITLIVVVVMTIMNALEAHLLRWRPRVGFSAGSQSDA